MNENERVMKEIESETNGEEERLSNELGKRDVSLDLFDDIGTKIKKLATINAWIGIIASIIGGIALASLDEDLGIWGVIIIIFGPLLSWLSSTTIYGFGQLIENSDTIVQQLKNK